MLPYTRDSSGNAVQRDDICVRKDNVVGNEIGEVAVAQSRL